ncbi:hypothetical protein [Mycolicibacterium sphagni]|uniref:Uncharacterized protein n=1 Tax=Mycolicibacterium sphagni TaxID=1786 RepID=A0ABX2JPL0_9MYCO|nr:hypothetical protein [Mycolicibacterium sphagni]NTY58732.1 hypothetical protein [Mycolicibacterium sphagni]
MEVELPHGYIAYEAADWRDVVLRIIDRDSLSIGAEGSGPVVYQQVDDIQIRWAGGTFEELYDGTLAPYRWTWWAV